MLELTHYPQDKRAEFVFSVMFSVMGLKLKTCTHRVVVGLSTGLTYYSIGYSGLNISANMLAQHTLH